MGREGTLRHHRLVRARAALGGRDVDRQAGQRGPAGIGGRYDRVPDRDAHLLGPVRVAVPTPVRRRPATNCRRSRVHRSCAEPLTMTSLAPVGRDPTAAGAAWAARSIPVVDSAALVAGIALNARALASASGRWSKQA